MRQLQSMGQALARCQIEVVQVNKLAEICRSLLLASELDKVGGDTRCSETRCETSDLEDVSEEEVFVDETLPCTSTLDCLVKQSVLAEQEKKSCQEVEIDLAKEMEVNAVEAAKAQVCLDEDAVKRV